VELRSPSVVPPFVSSVTVALNAAIRATADVPPELHRAAPSRQREYVAGRYCAARAIERLRPSDVPLTIGRGVAGEPQWPAGLTGSLTHTDGLASAAVARVSDARSIGIDSEVRVDAWRAERIRPLVMQPEESGVGGQALDAGTRVMLVFSAKEAIFKCLYPVVSRRFYYEDARILSADPATGVFVAELLTTLAPGFERGTVLQGRFEIDDRHVHTGVWLEPQRP
jgi:enterobactin synthetase component D / holo-[acyl-carrier protein] synthase